MALNQHPLLIGDRTISTASSLTVKNPYDGTIVAQVAMGDLSHIRQAIDAADSALEKTLRQPPHQRAELLLRIASGIEANKTKLTELLVAEAGKPITLAEGEVARAVITFTAAADEARRVHDESLDASAYSPGAGHVAVSRRVACGAVYAMSPFNFPINLVAHKIAPAIACGATMVLKPSPRTPLCALELGKIVRDAGAIAGQINIITCPNELAMSPIDDPRIKVVSFTGSAAIGWKIKQRAVKQKVTLELGGNAPVIVHEDADLDSAIPMIATGAFSYSGQSCISVQRILIHRPIYDRVRDRLVSYTREKIKTGDPKQPGVIVGPMISPESFQKTLDLIHDAHNDGASILCGGQSTGPCIQPTLMEKVSSTHELCREEAFAPIALLVPYDDFSDAIRIANDTPYGLQAGLFTHDARRIEQAFDQLHVGGVLINQVPTFRIDNLPYGGIKDSGFGREGPRYAIEEMTELKTLIIRRGSNRP